jgi:uncharacterized protein (DUF39 family)
VTLGEIFDSIAIPIPVLNEEILENLKILNKDIPLPICDIHGRHLPLGTTDYSLWENTDLRPETDLSKCLDCNKCIAEKNCPTNAFLKNKEIVEDLCYGCGICTTSCPGQVPIMNLGNVTLDVNGENKTIPVTCRQSDKKRGLEIAEDLKEALLDGSFRL